MLKVLRQNLNKLQHWASHTANRIILPGFRGLTLLDLWKIYAEGILKGLFTTRASSIAYSFFIAIFPFLLFILNLIPFVWFIEDFQEKVLRYIETILPPQTSAFFGSIFKDIASHQRGGLLSLVFILAIFFMANGINAIFTGFGHSYHTTDNRQVVQKYLSALLAAFIIAFSLLVTVIITIYLTYLIQHLNTPEIFNIPWAKMGSYFVFAALVYNAVATLYYFGVKKGNKPHYFSVGAIFTTFLILLMTFLFSVYIKNFSQYNELYGSIGALLILMIYIWLNSNILLLGHELNESIIKLKKQRDR